MGNKDYLNMVFECFADHKRYSENHILRQLKKADEMGVPEYEFFDRLVFALHTLVNRIKEKSDIANKPVFDRLVNAKDDYEKETILKDVIHFDEIPLPFDPVKDGNFPDMYEIFIQDLANFEMDIKNLIEQRKAEERGSEKNKTEPEPEIQDSGFRLMKGKKADLLRVLNALYELNFFADKDNNTKKIQFMKAFGKLINEDFSNYDSDLSQAYKAKHEVNLSIFEKLNKKTTDIYNERLDKTN